MSVVVSPTACAVIVVGVFELARKIHALSPEDRAVVLALVEDLKRVDASQSSAACGPAHSAVPSRLIRMRG